MASVICILCNEVTETPIYLTPKGAESINRCSVIRKNEIVATAESPVHAECRKGYTNNKVIQSLKKSLLILRAKMMFQKQNDHDYVPKSDTTFVYFAAK